MKTLRFSLTVFLFACAAAALRAVAVDSRITAVTVYPDRAIVTRTAKADLPAGQSELVFENLPASLADESLQVSGRGTAEATILDVNARTTYVDATPDPRVKSLQDELRDQELKLRTATDRTTVLEARRELLQRIGAAATTPEPAPREGVPAPRPGIDEWQKLLTFSDETLSKILSGELSLEAIQVDLQAKVSALKSQIEDLNGQQPSSKSYKTVTVHVAATVPGSLEVALAYAVPGASWTATYDARLHSGERTVALSYFGIVRQNTGEDWKDVALTLSTAHPSLGGGAPELPPWIVDVAKPEEPEGYSGRAMMGAAKITGPMTHESRAADSSMRLKMADSPFNVQVVTNAFIADFAAVAINPGMISASFKIPVASTVLSDNTPQKVGIATANLAAQLQYHATPRTIEAAFLSADATNTTDYPLLAGAMNTFLDDAFIAASGLKTVMPGEKFQLALGADEGIAIKRKLVNRFAEDTGLTGRGRRVTYEFLVTVTNHKKTAEHIVLKDVVPVSRNEKVEVKLINPAEDDLGTAANPGFVAREADGKLVWRFELKPGEKRELPLKFSIDYPADVTVTGLE